METNAKIVALPTAAVAAPIPTATTDFSQGRAAQDAEQAARYRLIIEEGPTDGTFIYKTLDSVTGEVVRQFPREQVLRMVENGSYAAGAMIDTTA